MSYAAMVYWDHGTGVVPTMSEGTFEMDIIAMDAGLIRGRATFDYRMDDGGRAVRAWLKPETWNGWGKPYIHVRDVRYLFPNGQVTVDIGAAKATYRSLEEDGEPDQTVPVVIIADGADVAYYMDCTDLGLTFHVGTEADYRATMAYVKWEWRGGDEPAPAYPDNWIK